MKISIYEFWAKLNGMERIKLMKKATGLSCPSAVMHWTNPPEAVKDYLHNHPEELESK
jgi:hypothetical protein